MGGELCWNITAYWWKFTPDKPTHIWGNLDSKINPMCIVVFFACFFFGLGREPEELKPKPWWKSQISQRHGGRIKPRHCLLGANCAPHCAALCHSSPSSVGGFCTGWRLCAHFPFFFILSDSDMICLSKDNTRVCSCQRGEIIYSIKSQVGADKQTG